MNGHRYLRVYSVLLCLHTGLAGFVIAPRPAWAGVKVRQTITADEAQQHAQETNTVCGVVASAKYADTAPAKLTYLNLGRPFPNQPFTAVVPPTVRPKFKVPPEELFKGKTICVTGLITIYRDKPQIVIADPSQIALSEPVASATNEATAATAK